MKERHVLIFLYLLMISLISSLKAKERPHSLMDTHEIFENATSQFMMTLFQINRMNDETICLPSEAIFQHKGIAVMQGNANAKSILLGSDDYLYTYNLSPCIALLIIDAHNGMCHLIHSDSATTKSVGGKSLKNVFIKLALSPDKEYTIGLIGGASAESLSMEIDKIKKILPRSTVELIGEGKSTAYLTGQGLMGYSKNELKSYHQAHFKKEL